MGRGGESCSLDVQDERVLKRVIRLKELSIEELRQWAKAYGLEEDKQSRLSDQDLLMVLAPYADGILNEDRPDNLPLEVPSFSLATIRDAIPSHCFDRNLFTSLTHLASDLAMIATLFYAASYIESTSLPSWSKYILWPVYWYAQGCVLTGVWVLAHECGHQSFSDIESANNIVGTICHSLLLVPYHSWRITHGRHHNNTGSCQNDEVFAPSTRSDWAQQMLRESPLACAWGIFLMLTVGWMPGYLVWNFTGPSKYRGRNANHFSPKAVFFTREEYWLIIQSDLAFLAALAFFIGCVYTQGISCVGAYYLIPYAVANYHLVLITYLQHTDVYMPHFRNREWNWLRGALCTVDRSFGPILDHAFHHITDTHVCHHLFSKMPFYHAQEATESIRKVLGPYYKKDETPIARALYRSFSTCLFVEDDGDTVFYKNVK